MNAATSQQGAQRDYNADLALALSVADEVDRLTLDAFDRHDVELGWKDDRTEVTEVDRAAEVMVRDRLLTERPGDAFVGEEFGHAGADDGAWRWIVDPIDGTSGFVRHNPVWATLLALEFAGDNPTDGSDPIVPVPHVAVVSAPALGRRWWAVRGGGSFAHGDRIQVSDVSTIADAQVNVTLNAGWVEAGRSDALVELMVRARRSRGVGDFWQHCLVAEGVMDLAIDAIGVAPYDLAAVRLIVEEAGGRFTDREGAATHLTGSAISSNGLLHDEAIALVRSD